MCQSHNLDLTSNRSHQTQQQGITFQDFLPILQDEEHFVACMELPSRDFLKKVDNYMRIRSGGRTPGLTSPVLGNTTFNFNPGTPRPDDMRAMPPR